MVMDAGLECARGGWREAGAWRGWDADEWAGLAAFLEPLLLWDPALRPTAAEAMAHPWLQRARDKRGAAAGGGCRVSRRWAARR